MPRPALAFAVVLAGVFVAPASASAAGIGLVPAGCVKDAATSVQCPVSAPGISNTNGLAISPSGDTVYAAASRNNDVATLRRAADGSLSSGGCVEDVNTGNSVCAAKSEALYTPVSVAAADDAVFVGSYHGLTQYTRGADGSLTPAGCLQTSSIGVCPYAPGLREVWGIALSPGGESLYTGSDVSDAVDAFARGAGAALTFSQCQQDPGAEPLGGNPPVQECATQTADGLNGATRVVISSDGRSVYAVSSSDNALVRFDRAADGTLTYQGCIDDNDTGPKPCAQSVDGLDFPTDVAVSADGRSVYVVSYFDQAVVRFNRAADGSLTPAGCLQNRDSPDKCPQGASGMARPWAVEVSPNGDSVYVAAIIGDGIWRFARAADGALTPAGCVTDAEKSNKACTVSSPGLDAVDALVLSPDGRNLYAGSWRATIQIFRRDLIAPDTRAKGPKTTTKRKVAFTLSATEPGATFECAIDNPASLRPCTAKFTTRTLGYRAHTLYVRAIDGAGNPDETPFKLKFTVKRPTK